MIAAYYVVNALQRRHQDQEAARVELPAEQPIASGEIAQRQASVRATAADALPQS